MLILHFVVHLLQCSHDAICSITSLTKGEKMKNKILNTLLLTLLTIPQAYASELVAHEWGTFTSVINKEGKMIQGLHHEEEALPNFVYDLSRLERTSRTSRPPTRGYVPASMNLMPIPTFTEKITQKMETPVIYFYSEKEMDVRVRVDFPKGVISQWFPKVSSVNPSVEAKNGYGVWDVKILNQNSANLPETSGNSIWNPSRETNANIVKVDNELEKLIFYRGLGDFNTPIRVTENNGLVTIMNNSGQNIKGLTLLNHREGINSYTHIKELKAFSEVTISANKNNFESFRSYLDSVKGVIVSDLVASGLYRDESVAMVNTWEGGYFQTKGLRLLYVLPIEWTEEILPMKIQPVPKKLVRTLVGRIEILTGEDDKSILKFVNNKIAKNLLPLFAINGRYVDGLGHFPEPKLRRALELDISVELKTKINSLLKSINSGFLN